MYVCMYVCMYVSNRWKSIVPALVEITFIDVKGTVERWLALTGAEEEDDEEACPLELPSYKLGAPAAMEVDADVVLL